jgi:hypothetical protein
MDGYQLHIDKFMDVKEKYYYLFYALFKFWEKYSVPKFWSDAKATFSIIVLEMLLASSMMTYYRVFFNKDSNLGEGIMEYIILFLLIVPTNYFLFIYNDTCETIIKKFDKDSKKNNRKSHIKVGILVIVILINFIVSFYLFFNI